jgi:hypothetical protein
VTRRGGLDAYPDAEPGGAPDAGLAAISAEFSASAGVARPGPAAAAELPRRGPLVKPSDVWLLDLPPGILSAAGTIDIPDWGPPTGWAWRITEVPVVLGTGTTLVQFYTQSAAGLASLIFQTSASGLWEPAHLYLRNGSRLVVVATGGGVTISPRGEMISLHFLPTYLA